MNAGAHTLASVCGVAEQLSIRARTSSDRNPNDVYAGVVMLPGLTTRDRAYVKVFPPAMRGQLVYNEVLGHAIALQCGLPSPLTFPCACRISLLRSATRAEMVDARSNFVLGVASVDGGSQEVKQSIASSESSRVEVLNWPHVARTAVLDELLGNDDRHIANLIRRGLHDYMLIDNERIMFGIPWFDIDLKSLEGRRCDPNILADTIAETTDDLMRKRMMDVAHHLMRVTHLTPPEACERIEALCGAPAGTTQRVVEMLNRRRLLLRNLLQWHLQKGDLFQARTNR
jgi:hypothetical protein